MLSRGDRGPKVKQVQQKVNVRVDGIYGPVTERAVKQYQRAHGLKVDGIVGPRTWASMFGGGSSGGGAGGAWNPLQGGLLDKVIGGILLYGIFKVLMKIF